MARFEYGVPSSGTSAHAFTLVHDSERDAFEAQLASLGTGTTMLVDTYDVERGVRAAVEAAGPTLGAVRIDSGDLPALAVSVRALLDSLGATSTRIILTGDLDEYSIAGAGGRAGRRLRGRHLAGHRVGRADRGAGLQAGGAVGRAARRRRPGRAGRAAAGGEAVGGKAGPGRAQVGRARAHRHRRGGDRAHLARAARRAPTDRPLLQELVSNGNIVGREPIEAARARHARCWPSCPRTRCSSPAVTRRSRPSSAPTAGMPDQAQAGLAAGRPATSAASSSWLS